MKAREYIEHCFIPWILFLDSYDTIKHFENSKEEYLCETYNHISAEFKSLDHYELYMFRVTVNKIVLPIGSSTLIFCKTPDVKQANDASCLIIIYNDENLLYYTLKYAYNNTFQLERVERKDKKVIDTLESPNYDSILSSIRRDLLL